MREKSKHRKTDEVVEKLNNKFLEKYFYNSNVEKYIRNTDKKLQISGIDVIFIKNGIQYNCDEKVAVHYINKALFTFAFELSFIDRKGDIRPGWFLDNKKLNNSYLLCWIDEADVDKPTNIEQIKKSEIILITKDKIVEYLKSINWTLDMINKKTNDIRYNKDKNFGNIKRNGLKFSFSEQLVEKPINVIIPREVLRDPKYCSYNEIIKK